MQRNLKGLRVVRRTEFQCASQEIECSPDVVPAERSTAG